MRSRREPRLYIRASMAASLLGTAMFMNSVACAQAGSPSNPTPVADPHQAIMAPTDLDLYCSGYLTKDSVSDKVFISGGLDSPEQMHFGGSDLIYMSGGNFQPGQRFQIVRHAVDPDRYADDEALEKRAKRAGAMYEELGIVEVVTVRAKTAVVKPVLSCKEMVPGDIALPFQERERPQFRMYPKLAPIAAPDEKPAGEILRAGGFDVMARTHTPIYLSIGSDHNLKPGDYVSITRTYPSLLKRRTDSTSVNGDFPEIGQVPAKGYDRDRWDIITAKKKQRLESFPRQTIGRAIVLFTTKTTATALVTDELKPVMIGDDISIMEPGVPMPKASVPKPPTLECAATPETVQAGLVASVVCNGRSEDGRPLSYIFHTSAGQLEQHGNTALLDTRDVASGVVTVTAKVMDDRDLTANSEIPINVAERAAAVLPVAASAGSLPFKRQSAYVDNRAKAMLDGIALRMQQDPTSTLTIGGGAHQTEKAGLAQARAENAKRYLTKEKGIDATRVTAKPGKSSEPEAEVWVVPAGAQQPL